MGTDASDDDLGPGLHVLREAEPLKRAGTMAARLRAELCATRPQAEATLADRSAMPLLDRTTLSTLEVLARRLARAERIAARTRERAVAEVGQHLAVTGAALAVHPTTIRDRAAAVTTARDDLDAAERAIVDHEAARAEAAERAAAEAAERQAALDASTVGAATERVTGVTPAIRRSRSIGAIVAALGLGLVLLAAGAVPLWLTFVPALAACLWALWYLKPREDDDPVGRAEVSSLLAEVGATTDEVFGARLASHTSDDQLTLLTSQRDRAQELLRVAERAWRDLAGEDVDVADVEDVVKRFDPQHEDARLLAGETAGVRASEVVLHHFQQRWLAFWRELGLDAPPAQSGEAAVAALAARATRPIVLVGPASELGADIARAAPAAPVVVLDGPGGDAAEHDLLS